MSINNKRLLVCNCEGTMEIETELLEKALELKSSLFKHSQLCRAQIEMFEKEIRNPGEVLVACTQEAPMFLETTSATGNEHANIQFTNIVDELMI